jgi:hypothetical protein
MSARQLLATGALPLASAAAQAAPVPGIGATIDQLLTRCHAPGQAAAANVLRKLEEGK